MTLPDQPEPVDTESQSIFRTRLEASWNVGRRPPQETAKILQKRIGQKGFMTDPPASPDIKRILEDRSHFL